MNKPEYRVRPVTRYVVTMHGECATSTIGEFSDRFYADCVAEAMNAHEFKYGEVRGGANPLANIPQLLKNIVAQLEEGSLEAKSGVLILRADDQRLPAVFGLGAKVNPWKELELAGKAVDKMVERASSTPGDRL